MNKIEEVNFEQEVIDHLTRLGKGEADPEEVCVGICHEMLQVFGLRTNLSIFRSWGKFSGNYRYPVPSPISSGKSEVSYQYRSDPIGRDNWDSSTEYGRNRRDLCLYLAEKASEDFWGVF